MTWFHQFIWKILYPKISAVAFWWIENMPTPSRTAHWIKERHSYPARQLPPANAKQHALFLCPSAGEYESIKYIIHLYKLEQPNSHVEVAFFSTSGIRHIDASPNPFVDHYHSLWPIDRNSSVNEFFSKRDIQFAAISTLAIWPATMNYLTEHNIPYYFIGTKVRPTLLKKLGLWTWKYYLENAVHIYDYDFPSSSPIPQNLSNVTFIKDLRIATIAEDIESKSMDLSVIHHFKKDHKLLVVGSSHFKDEQFLNDSINELIQNKWRIVLAPHEINRSKDVKAMFANSVLLSQDHISDNVKVLILDKHGWLKALYATADIAYVGGGIDGRIHNLLEPLIAGCKTVIFRDTNLYNYSNDIRKMLKTIERLSDITTVFENHSDEEIRQEHLQKTISESKEDALMIANELCSLI